MPRGSDIYVHRIGRTGRAGAKGTAISIIEAHDFEKVGKVERYTKESFKARVIEGLRPKNKPPKVIKKKKVKVKGNAKNKKAKGKTKFKKKTTRPSSPKSKEA